MNPPQDNNALSAVERVLSIPELAEQLIQHIGKPTQLNRLRLVSKLFLQACAPQFWIAFDFVRRPGTATTYFVNRYGGLVSSIIIHDEPGNEGMLACIQDRCASKLRTLRITTGDCQPRRVLEPSWLLGFSQLRDLTLLLRSATSSMRAFLAGPVFNQSATPPGLPSQGPGFWNTLESFELSCSIVNYLPLGTIVSILRSFPSLRHLGLDQIEIIHNPIESLLPSEVFSQLQSLSLHSCLVPMIAKITFARTLQGVKKVRLESISVLWESRMATMVGMDSEPWRPYPHLDRIALKNLVHQDFDSLASLLQLHEDRPRILELWGGHVSRAIEDRVRQQHLVLHTFTALMTDWPLKGVRLFLTNACCKSLQVLRLPRMGMSFAKNQLQLNEQELEETDIPPSLLAWRMPYWSTLTTLHLGKEDAEGLVESVRSMMVLRKLLKALPRLVDFELDQSLGNLKLLDGLGRESLTTTLFTDPGHPRLQRLALSMIGSWVHSGPRLEKTLQEQFPLLEKLILRFAQLR